MWHLVQVAGNFHVALGDSAARGGAHIHQFNPTKMHLFNTTHRVNSYVDACEHEHTTDRVFTQPFS